MLLEGGDKEGSPPPPPPPPSQLHEMQLTLCYSIGRFQITAVSTNTLGIELMLPEIKINTANIEFWAF